jgi:hypothetical protein
MKKRAIVAVLVGGFAGACSGGDGPGGGVWMPGGGDANAPDTTQGVADTGAVDDGSAPDTSTEPGNDAPVDVADQADGTADAAAIACGPPPARYTLLTGADAGLVRDNVTMLVWMNDSHGAGEPPQTQSAAAAYCMGRGMRLPTKDEAVALAADYAACAFGHWGTWTSTAAAAMGYAWVVDYAGDVSPQLADNFPSAVLCVRDPAG